MKSKYRIKKPFYKQAFPMTIFILLTLYVISFLLPFSWALFKSFNSYELYQASIKIYDNDELSAKLIKALGLPIAFGKLKEGFTFDNYLISLNFLQVTTPTGKADILRLFFNSFVYAIGVTVASTMTQAICSYIVARYSSHKIAAMLYPVVIFVMILPIVGNLPSELQIMRDLGIYDRVWGLFIMRITFGGTNFLIFYATFKGISWEYAEAAFIDGASHSTVMWQIMMPLAAGATGALMLIAFITNWNDWQVNVKYLPTTWPMLSYSLYRFRSVGAFYEKFNGIWRSNDITVQMAASLMIAIPLVILFITFRKKIMNNLTMGGLKG